MPCPNGRTRYGFTKLLLLPSHLSGLNNKGSLKFCSMRQATIFCVTTTVCNNYCCNLKFIYNLIPVLKNLLVLVHDNHPRLNLWLIYVPHQSKWDSGEKLLLKLPSNKEFLFLNYQPAKVSCN